MDIELCICICSIDSKYWVLPWKESNIHTNIKQLHCSFSLYHLFPFPCYIYLQTVPDQKPLELTPSLFLKVSPENYMFTGGCNNTDRWAYNSSSCSTYNLDFLNNTNISGDPRTSLSPLSNYSTSPLSNYSTDSLPDVIPDSLLSSPAPSEYLESLYRPCGIGASDLDQEECGSQLREVGDVRCHGLPGLRCTSLCGECKGNSTHFPTEPPTCFDGSISS